MANTTNLNVRIDADLKHQAETIFTALGMNLSTAMNLFLRSAVRYGGIPFELKLPQKPLGLEAMSHTALDAKLAAGIAAMQAGTGRPANEFFNDLEKELGFGDI